MESEEDIRERKVCIIDQVKKLVSIFQELKFFEKDMVANKEDICRLIMEYQSIMENPKNVFNFRKNSPRAKKKRRAIRQLYAQGLMFVGFSQNVYCEIKRCQTSIKELNFVLGQELKTEE